jgi:hypothetical protein
VAQKPTIFISCGQRTEEERALGKRLQQIVSAHFVAYFAATVRDIEGLTGNIFDALDKAAGYIAVMHQRGTVRAGESKFLRGSVWIEQELAIVAFLRYLRRQPIRTLFLLEKGIEAEGLRKQLIGEPEFFEGAEEVVEKVRVEIETWVKDGDVAPSTAIAVEFKSVEAMTSGDTREFQLGINIRNAGKATIKEWRANLIVPKLVRPSGKLRRADLPPNHELHETHVFCEYTESTMANNGALGPLRKNQELLLLPAVNFTIDRKIYLKLHELTEQEEPQVVVEVWPDEEDEPIRSEIGISRLHNY